MQTNIHALTVNQKAKQTVLPAKKLLILTGPAGCGKTSLLKAVCTSLHHDSSEGIRLISWTDLPSSDFQARALSNSGMIDYFQLFSCTTI
jgi:ABC-type cobalamin/Fe3+-siderophores transport system ATPase subunit